jgi:hypothetical protein
MVCYGGSSSLLLYNTPEKRITLTEVTKGQQDDSPRS